MAPEERGEQTPTLAGMKSNLYWCKSYSWLCSGCDVPTHLYSFSFNLNPNWSKELCDQLEILECKLHSLDDFIPLMAMFIEQFQIWKRLLTSSR